MVTAVNIDGGYKNLLTEKKYAPNILLVVNTLTLGGAEAQAVMMAKLIRDNSDNKPVIVGLICGGPLEKILQDDALEYHILHFNFSLFYKSFWRKISQLLNLIRFMRKMKPTAVISSTYYPNLVINIACVFIARCTNYWYQVGKEWDVPISFTQKLAQQCTKNFLANSFDVKGYMTERLKIKPTNISVITNLFFNREIQHSREYWLKQLNLNEQDFVIVLASNFFEVKDQLTAVKALAIILQNKKQVKLVLAGYSPEPNYLLKLKALAFDLNLGGHIIFTDSTSDVFGLLQVAKIGLFTSIKKHTEGSPTIIMEYMYAGLPVVASCIDCNKELFEGLDMEALYEPENEHDLAKVLLRYIENKELRDKFSVLNKDKAVNEFQPINLLQQLKHIGLIN